jgi:hypothetical protein
LNTWQCSRQIAYTLSKLTWEDSPSTRVFGSVHVTQGPSSEAADILRPTLALVRVLDSTSDDEDTRIILQKFEVVLAVAHAGDNLGEYAMIGGQRKSRGESSGRGLLEIEERVTNALNEVDLGRGQIGLQLVSAGAAEGQMVEGIGYVATRGYTFEGWLTTTRTYAKPNYGNKLTSSVNAGTVTLSWTLVDRFDFHAANSILPSPHSSNRGSVILRRASGSTPPSSSSSGTGVTLSGDFATTVNDTPGSGTWSYALFAEYDEFGNDTSLRYSDAATVTVSV